MRSTPKSFAALSFALTLLGSWHHAQVVAVYDTLTEADLYECVGHNFGIHPSSFGDTDESIGLPIVPTASGALHSIEVPLLNHFAGDNTGLVSIYDDAGGLPGSALWSGQAQFDGVYCSSDQGLSTVMADGSLTLEEGVQYWVVVENATEQSFGFWAGNTVGVKGNARRLADEDPWLYNAFNQAIAARVNVETAPLIAVYDTLTDDDSYQCSGYNVGTSSFGSSQESHAVPFTPSSSGGLHSIELPVLNHSSSGDGTARVSIHADAAGMPGSELWSAQADLPGTYCSTDQPLSTVSGDGSFQLQAGTQYWVAVGNATPDSFGFWAGNTIAPGDSMHSYDGGATWFDQNDTPLPAARILVTSASIVATETVRLGVPANANALLPGQTSAPIVGQTWDPMIDHASFKPFAFFDILMISAAPDNQPTAIGTLLCALPANPLLFTVPSGNPIPVPLPLDPSLIGKALCAQGGAVDVFGIELTNALDIVLGEL